MLGFGGWASAGSDGSSWSTTAAAVIRQSYERGDEAMVEVLPDLEANELLRLKVIDLLRRIE